VTKSSPILGAISQELRELEAAAAKLGDLSEDDHLALYPKISALRDARRRLTEELERRA
jgi:hypothetical protein